MNFFKAPAFYGFQKVIDKRLTSLGIGVKWRQAEPISVEEEKMMGIEIPW